VIGLVSVEQDEVPDGTTPDARDARPGRALIDSWLGDGWDLEWRPGEHVTVDSEEAADRARTFREVLGRYCSGVTVVTTVADETPAGMTCQSFTSVSLDPPLVAFLPTRSSRAFAAIQRSGRFCVNFLAADQVELSDRMASSADGKFEGVAWTATPDTGSPLLAGVVGHVDCTVHAVHEAGDHYIVIGRVLALEPGESEAPLLYYRGGYHTTA
jgi:3-hydroxy-9,10-secoandrosta-1,3,5(10)-triene-9,17-dione monooxygenase reductase component